MDADLQRLRGIFAGPEPGRIALPQGSSAVLLPLLPRPEGLSVLFTLRHRELSRHAGQWSFPGGRIEAQDRGPAAAALRETEEEVGVPPACVETLGHLTDYTTYYGLLVCAYVGALAKDAPAPRIAASDEVSGLLVVPLRRLLEPDAYEGRTLPGTGRNAVVHYWHVAGAEVPVWGITAELLARFLARAYGWQPPKAPRLLRSAEEFRELARQGL